MKNIKIIVEKHPDGYVAYPLGVEGIVIGEGDTYEAALADVKSALSFHVETFGARVLNDGTETPLTLPNHKQIKSSTLRTICTQAGITREEFLKAYQNS
jgi:predicted RNase H-like HicB family nuclease